MQTLNVLIAGEGKLLPLVKSSKFLKKLYATSDVEGAVNVKFNTFAELAKKCKALQIDVVLVENEKWILQGIADVLRKSFVNCIAPNALLSDILTNSLLSRKFLSKYHINIPQKMKYPSKYPLLLRGKGFKFKANSLDEVLQVKDLINKTYPQEIVDTTFLEEFIEGKGVSVIEWPNFIEKLIPPNILEIVILNTGDNSREITFKTNSKRYSDFFNTIKEMN